MSVAYFQEDNTTACKGMPSTQCCPALSPWEALAEKCQNLAPLTAAMAAPVPSLPCRRVGHIMSLLLKQVTK